MLLVRFVARRIDVVCLVDSNRGDVAYLVDGKRECCGLFDAW